jgi:hypothetical protein
MQWGEERNEAGVIDRAGGNKKNNQPMMVMTVNGGMRMLQAIE